MRRMLLVAAMTGVLAQLMLPAAMAAPEGNGARPVELPRQDAARGVVTRGLAVATDGPCAGLLEVTNAARGGVCTHGPDPAPPQVADVRTADFDAADAEQQAATAPPFTCDGDGVSGRRAHAIYAVAPDRVDRFDTYAAAFRGVLARVQDEFRQSSVVHGATDPLVFRFTHTKPVDGTCTPLLDHVVLPSSRDDDSFGATIAALESLGYTDPARRYLVFVDANVLCGVASYYADDRQSPDTNRNNVLHKALFSRVDAPCWGYAETHELAHNIGAVQHTAPHTTGIGHCNDDHDIMCYADGGSLSALTVVAGCTDKALWERRLDCGGDDYFNPSPPAGSYLAGHWNTARSGWLFTHKPALSTTTGTGTSGTSGVKTSSEPTPEPEPEPTPEPTPPTTSVAPKVSITAPSSGVTQRTVTIRGGATDSDGDLAGVRVFVDGVRVATLGVAGATSSWSRQLVLAPGDRELAVQAVDATGKRSTLRSVGVTALHDVPSGDLFADDDASPFEPAIERLAVQGVTRGCNPPSNTKFCPEDAVTRGQMAAFLTRALELPAASGVDFADDDRSAFEDAIERLAAAGITHGCNPPSNTRFCPDDVVTRGQMAAFLTRALELPAASGVDFADDDRSVFEDAIERLAGAGITMGCNPPSNTRFCPDAPVTRGQMAAFLTRGLYA